MDIKATIQEMAVEYIPGFQQPKKYTKKKLPTSNLFDVTAIRRVQEKEKPTEEIH